MQKVTIRGADGQKAILAFVRQDERTVYACALDRFKQVAAGDEGPVVGFPREDAELLNGG